MDRKEQIKQLENEWNSSDRWANVKRGYKAEDVVRLRGSFVPECSSTTLYNCTPSSLTYHPCLVLINPEYPP